MIVKYDSLNRLETPNFILCNPGSRYNNGVLTNVIGGITDTEAEEIVFNFNETSELNMRVNRIQRGDKDADEYTKKIYRALQNRRLIFIDDIGYFVITGVNDNYDGSKHYKDISAKSVDIELAQKMIPYIPNGTYRFTTDTEGGTAKGILETIVETLPLWTIGDVDTNIESKYRTFEDVDISTNCLSFMLENLQDAYECIFIFDCINRTINVYAQNDYIRQTDIHITKDDLINELDISENSEDIYTAISVMGDENVTISAINPLSSNVIYKFDYYLSWMSDGLRERVKTWQEKVEQAFTDESENGYYTNSLNYYKKLAEIANYQMELDRLNILLSTYRRCQENIVAGASKAALQALVDIINNNKGKYDEFFEISTEVGETLDTIKANIATYSGEYETTKGEMETAQGEADALKAKISAIQKELSIKNYFEANEYEELSYYIFEGSYTDEYVIITDNMGYEEKFNQMKLLYDRAKNQLERVSQPTQEFSVGIENFIFKKEFEKWSKQLETGCLINVELDTNDIALLFLSSMTINYDDRSLNMTFGNRFNKFDPRSLFNDVLGNISKSANTLDYIKEVLYPIRSGEFNSMKNDLRNSRNLAMNAALTSENEEVVIDSSGYTSKERLEDGIYDPHQVKLTGRQLVFTDNAWENCKVAIGELPVPGSSTDQTIYGINAEAIIGDIILGNELRILNDEGEDLLTVVDERISSSVADESGKIKSEIEQTAEGINIIIKQICSEKDGEYTVDRVKTSTGYTFDESGLEIYKEGNEIKNLLDNTGMYVKRVDAEKEENVLVANNDGVEAINLKSKQYLIVGKNSRFEDYTESRTGCFYIGQT